MDFLFPILMLGAMWFFLLRPQQQRVKRHRALLTTLAVGDEVVTAGGVLGRVVGLTEDRVELEVGPGTTLAVVRPAITQKVAPQGEDAPGPAGGTA